MRKGLGVVRILSNVGVMTRAELEILFELFVDENPF